MASSNVFLKVLRNLFPLRDFLYVLQLEEYETIPYAKSALRLWFRRGIEKRDVLRFTARVKATAAICVALQIVFAVFIVAQFPSAAFLAAVASVCIAGFFTPDFVGLAHVILLPFSALQKARLQRNAEIHFAGVGKNTKVIAIAGSYGKTTTRHFIHELLKESYKTQVMPGNINTVMGIAQWLVTKFDPSTQVLLVEMDAYHSGEIAASCRMVNPDIAVLTSIGDQHMVRFGTRARLTEAMQEVFAGSKASAPLICDSETAKTLKEHGYIFDLTLVNDSSTYRDQPHEATLSQSALHDLRFALAVAEQLNVPAHFAVDIIQNLTSPDRRQQPGTMYGYDAIDDSYNISETTAHAGIAAAKELAAKKGKKLLVLTAGISELSPRDADVVNKRYGSYLAEHADAVMVLTSIYHPALTEGLGRRIPTLSAPSLTEAVSEIQKQFAPEGYVLLVQPEMTDLSY